MIVKYETKTLEIKEFYVQKQNSTGTPSTTTKTTTTTTITPTTPEVGYKGNKLLITSIFFRPK